MFLELFLLILGLLFCLAGILGGILPLLPGPPLSWLGLLMLYLLPNVPLDYWFLGLTLGLALLILAVDYAMPVIGTKYFGGSRAGTIGSTLGLIIGLFFPPLGFVLGPFAGAFLGELFFNAKSNSKYALKAAIGSFMGFLASTFMKVLMAIVYLSLFIYKFFEYYETIFNQS